jgi:hypothetical protein
VLPKYCFGNPDLLVGTRLITLSRNGVPVAEKNTESGTWTRVRIFCDSDLT